MKSCSKTSFRSEWNVPASDFARKTFNPIVSVVVKQWQTKPESDKAIINVSPGDPSVFGNFPPPPVVQENVPKDLRNMTSISIPPPGGLPFARDAIAKYHSLLSDMKISWEDVYIVTGCSSAIELALRVLTNPGDNILVPCPGFCLYAMISNSRDVETREYRLLPEKSWNIDLKHLESLIDSRTKVLCVLNPSNPCGSVYSKEHLQDVIRIAEKHRIPILTDEVYGYLTFKSAKFWPVATLSKNVPVLTCSGLAKRFHVPGWRLGWLIVHDRNGILSQEVITGLEHMLHDMYHGCSVIQSLLPKILLETKQDFFDKAISRVESNAVAFYASLSIIDGLNPIMPKGAIYMMVGIDTNKFDDIEDDNDLASLLIKEQSLYVMPCSALACPNYIRIVLTPPAETVKEICLRMTEFFQNHKKK